ncbi:MAG: hypothetical protein QW416_04250 [Candidatus Nitrosocaldaceae archaeon]
MFKAPSKDDINRLVCIVCRYSVDVPMHHNKPMRWILEGNFVKKEYLICSVCNHKIEVPLHCNEPMIYSTSNYDDVSI